MGARLLVAAVLLASCGGRAAEPQAPTPTPRAPAPPDQPITVRFQLAPGESAVYVSVVGESEEDDSEEQYETYRVEHLEEGRLVVVESDSHDPAHVDWEPVQAVFPVPPEPVTPGVHRYHYETDNRHRGRAQPVEEELTVELRGPKVALHFRRQVGGDRRATEEGDAIYSPAAQRFESITYTSVAGSGETDRHDLDYDARLSRERTAMITEARQEGAGTYDAYVAAHGAHEEIEELLGGLGGGTPNATLVEFYLHGRPSPAVWSAVLDRPGAGPAFTAGIIEPFRRELSDETIASIRQHWSAASFAYPLVAYTADERLRPELRRLAAGRGQTAELARGSLDALEVGAQPTRDAIRARSTSVERLRTLWD